MSSAATSHDPIWRALWDAGLTVASSLLARVLRRRARQSPARAADRRARLVQSGLFTDFSARAPVGILDWYTVIVGVFAVAALALHGATFLVWKTDGLVHDRSRRLATRLAVVVAAGWVLVTIATVRVNATFFAGFAARPGAWAAIAGATGGLAAVGLGLRRQRPLVPFLGSCTFLAGLLGATAITIFPEMLRSIGASALSITAYSAANDTTGLWTALGWWIIGFPLAVLYFVVVFRLHRGKVTAPPEGEGY